jgi:hypothetical protein
VTPAKEVATEALDSASSPMCPTEHDGDHLDDVLEQETDDQQVGQVQLHPDLRHHQALLLTGDEEGLIHACTLFHCAREEGRRSGCINWVEATGGALPIHIYVRTGTAHCSSLYRAVCVRTGSEETMTLHGMGGWQKDKRYLALAGIEYLAF